MIIKVFESNKDGKIELSKADLEKLLDEIYKDGYRDGYAEGNSKTFTWTSPYLSTISPTITTNSTNTTNSLKCELADHKPGTALSCNEAVTISGTLEDIVKDFIAPKAKTSSKPHDVFEGLAKELNF